MNPKISIIIPVYNCELYLDKCLASVLNQTYHNIEVICVDDDSKDHSFSILNEYAKKDPRLKAYTKQNEGVSLSRNYALNKATGDYVMFVDADDWIDTKTCEISLNSILEKQVNVVLWSFTKEFKNKSEEVKLFDENKIFTEDDTKFKLYRKLFGLMNEELSTPQRADNLSTVWGKLYRRDIIEKNNIRFNDIRNLGTFEDGLFNIDYLSYCTSAYYVNECFYHYRRDNVSSITTRYNPNLWNQYQNIYSIINKHIGSNDLEDTFKIALSNRIAVNLIPLGINIMASKEGRIKEFKKILNDQVYINAISKLDTRPMPIYWKLFFKLAKMRFSIGVYVLFVFIQIIRGR